MRLYPSRRATNGEHKQLVFAGCVCASCSEAFDRQWAGSAVTHWLVTMPVSFLADADGEKGLVMDLVLLDTTYEQMKEHSWAANDRESRHVGFFRLRLVTSAELAHLKSHWNPAVWSLISGACLVRPATSEEIAAKKRRDWERQITKDTDQMIRQACKRYGIPGGNLSAGDPKLVEQAVREIAENLHQLGWLEELAEIQRSGNLTWVDNWQFLEIVLRYAYDVPTSEIRVVDQEAKSA
jgi:hypothetical protein